MSEALWFAGGASVLGKSHALSSTPCQDAHSIKISSNGQWLAIAVSDGAGSAKFSDQSAKLISDKFTQSLIGFSEKLEANVPGSWITDFLLNDIIQARYALRKLAASDNLKDYHCTLVAALIGPSGGFSIHLGDGAIIGGNFDSLHDGNIDLSSPNFESAPENGEYANETFFITESDWIRHVRIEPLPKISWIVLGTDGGMALATLNDRTPKSGFIKPLIQVALHHRKNRASIDEDVKKILSDPQADRLTNDDKTLVVAINSTAYSIDGEFRVPSPAQQSTQLASNPSKFAEPAAPTEKTDISLGDKKSKLAKKKSTKPIGIINFILGIIFGAALVVVFLLVKDKYFQAVSDPKRHPRSIESLKGIGSSEADVVKPPKSIPNGDSGETKDKEATTPSQSSGRQ
jgi:hypothetical protein